MSRQHILKLHDHYWNAVMDGSKCFEIRNNDRGFQKGDTIRFRYVDDLGDEAWQESDEFEITYVFSHEWIKPGHVVFGMKRVTK